MMNRGDVLQSSVVQQQMMGGNPNSSSGCWWNMINNYSHHEPASPSPYVNVPTTTSSLPFPSFLDNQHLPHSWSHLLMSGLVCEEDKGDMCHEVEEQMVGDVKQERFVYDGHGRQDLTEAAKASSWSQVLEPHAAASPKSCATGFSSSSMLDFSNNINTDAMPSPPDPSSECNSTTAGGAFKKARVQPSTSQSQSTIKVRKEKLGDRITALHQLVSPFGKTDTASVLLEAIGYIRFLQSQIEALSLPYLGSGSGNMRHQQHSHTNTLNVQGEKNCIFPEDPGQLLNENCLKRKAACEPDCEEEAKKDLRSRGLCLVPVSCTLQVGSDNNINGADYWAPPAFAGGFL